MLKPENIEYIKSIYTDEKEADFIAEKAEELYNKIYDVVKKDEKNTEANNLLVDLILAKLDDTFKDESLSFEDQSRIKKISQTLNHVLKIELA